MNVEILQSLPPPSTVYKKKWTHIDCLLSLLDYIGEFGSTSILYSEGEGRMLLLTSFYCRLYCRQGVEFQGLDTNTLAYLLPALD